MRVLRELVCQRVRLHRGRGGPEVRRLLGGGVQWFKSARLWHDRGYEPQPGDIVFFDWGGDGGADHVGIVESCDGSTVHTIEGNTSDSCARRSYRVGSASILGYGTPLY